MRVNASAVVGAMLATVLAVVGGAAHPAQLVATIAAAGAFLAVLSRGRGAVPGDWLTVQVLLAGNLVVFGISDAHKLGGALAALAALAGVLLLVAALVMYQRWPGEHGRGR
jgi:hypothetical protein